MNTHFTWQRCKSTFYCKHGCMCQFQFVIVFLLIYQKRCPKLMIAVHKIQLRAKQTAPLIERKDVSFILNILRISGTNDTSFESPYIGRLESAKKLGVASSWGWPRPLNWKSTTFTRTHLEPFMTEILPVSKLLSIGTS